MSKKLRNIWLLVFFAIGCSAQWDPPTPEPERPSQRQQGVLSMSTTYAGNNVFPTEVTIPSDGDIKPVASINVALEGLADRTIWLEQRTNDFKWYINDDNSGDDPANVESFAYDTIGNTRTKSALILVDIAGCAEDDLLNVRLHVGGVVFAGYADHADVYFNLYAIDDTAGAATYSRVQASLATLSVAGANGQAFPLTLHGRHAVSASGTTRIGLEVRLATVDAGSEAVLTSGAYLEVHRIKASP